MAVWFEGAHPLEPQESAHVSKSGSCWMYRNTSTVLYLTPPVQFCTAVPPYSPTVLQYCTASVTYSWKVPLTRTQGERRAEAATWKKAGTPPGGPRRTGLCARGMTRRSKQTRGRSGGVRGERREGSKGGRYSPRRPTAYRSGHDTTGQADGGCFPAVLV